MEGGRDSPTICTPPPPAKEPQLKRLLLVTLGGSGSVGSGLGCGGEEQETGVSEKAQTCQHLVKFSGW